ncbi:MAG: hypothetical protein ACLUEQ_11510 [Cloacibacillus evryensis]
MLEVIRRVSFETPLDVPTFKGAHAVPQEWKNDADALSTTSSSAKCCRR